MKFKKNILQKVLIVNAILLFSTTNCFAGELESCLSLNELIHREMRLECARQSDDAADRMDSDFFIEGCILDDLCEGFLINIERIFYRSYEECIATAEETKVTNDADCYARYSRNTNRHPMIVEESIE